MVRAIVQKPSKVLFTHDFIEASLSSMAFFRLSFHHFSISSRKVAMASV